MGCLMVIPVTAAHLWREQAYRKVFWSTVSVMHLCKTVMHFSLKSIKEHKLRQSLTFTGCSGEEWIQALDSVNSIVQSLVMSRWAKPHFHCKVQPRADDQWKLFCRSLTETLPPCDTRSKINMHKISQCFSMHALIFESLYIVHYC